MIQRRFVLGLLPLVLSVAAPTRAAGRLPAASAVVLDPHESKTIAVRTTFGLLVTRDTGDSWRWICDRAIGPAPAEGTTAPTWVITSKGTLVGATATGIALSRDGGCTFTRHNDVLKSLVMRADGELVGVTSQEKKTGESTLHDNHLVISKDDAQTFTVSGGPIDPAVGVEGIAISASDPVRLYLSGVQGEGEKRTGAFLASYDGGMSWIPRKLELVAGETAALVAGVDPKNADRVYVRTTGDVSARLLVTDDAGKTWKKILDSSGPVISVALVEDGSRIFTGAREGVSSSPTNGAFTFTKGSSIDSQCLAASSTGLWSCSTERSGFFVGVSRSSGRSFDAKLHLDEIKGPLDCSPESSVGKECVAQWPKLRTELGLPEAGDNKPKGDHSGGPALRGRAQRTGRSRGGFAAVAGIALLGLVGYNILKRLRRR